MRLIKTQKRVVMRAVNLAMFGVFIAVNTLPTTLMASPSNKAIISNATVLKTQSPLTINYVVKGLLTKRVLIDVNNPKDYANFSLYANEQLLLDNINIPKTGQQQISALVKFETLGDVTLTVRSNHADLTINRMWFEDVDGLNLPAFDDISVKAGIDKVSSIKYGGPTIADLDNDGDYDFIVNNHNGESSKLYWNDGDGTVTKHGKNLSRWRLQDLHGTAAGDYDNDGDLDLVLTLGGGNGKNPSKANFYHNNDGALVLTTGDVGIDRGARGRGASWSDMDLDGDLDLMLINEVSLHYKDDPQHLFYENLGDGTFVYRQVPKLEMNRAHRALVTDINNDNIDDVVLYGPLSLWLGNGDFTFTEATSQLPENITKLEQSMAVTDIDIDNDGDLDLYVARGKEFEHGFGETPWIDMDAVKQEFSIRSRGYAGTDQFEFNASGSIKFHKYYYLAQGVFRDINYSVFLGEQKTKTVLASSDELEILPEVAQGWPDDISEDGIYFGHMGDGKWKAALVRNGDIFWGFKFSLLGVNEAFPDFVPQNRNDSDFLLRNDGGSFTDVSKEWNIPLGSNSLGVTTGDFNNDTHQDLLVYRWGLIGERISDYMLLNNGNGSFETVTMHGANDLGGPGHGDMGQAFDFDLDGNLDLLSGSENGEWYLYSNQTSEQGNYVLVDVGYAPKSNVDAIAAEVIVKTPMNEYRKRVGSAGGVFSQSLLNIVHFGLGEEESIKSIKVRWRNGEEIALIDKKANRLYDTDKVDPESVEFAQTSANIRKGTSLSFTPIVKPSNADLKVIWSSSNEAALKVDQQGIVTAVGSVGDIAVITATSTANGLSASVQTAIEKWFEQPLKSVTLTSEKANMIAGQTLALQATLLPPFADDTSIAWSSSDPSIASVDSMGVVSAKKAGVLSVTASSNAQKHINDTVEVTVEPFVKPSLTLLDEDKYGREPFVIGDNITFNVDYHAGAGNTVISSDQGGMKFWLRHFKVPGKIAGKDYIVINTDVLGTSSGRASTKMLFHAGLLPSAELPEGHYYSLRVSFTNSDGAVLNKIISPVMLVEAAEK